MIRLAAWIGAAVILLAAGCSNLSGGKNMKSAVVIDVRTPGEYMAGHIEGALLMPHDRIGDSIRTEVPDKATPIILYCRSGARAEQAKFTLEQLGYSQVENYGGMLNAKRRLDQQ